MINTAEQMALLDRLSRKATSEFSKAHAADTEGRYLAALDVEREAYGSLNDLIDGMAERGELTWEEAKKARDSIWGAPSY